MVLQSTHISDCSLLTNHTHIIPQKYTYYNVITKNPSCGTMGRTTHSRTYTMQPLTEAFQTCMPGGLYQNLCMQFCVLSGNIILKKKKFQTKSRFYCPGYFCAIIFSVNTLTLSFHKTKITVRLTDTLFSDLKE